MSLDFAADKSTLVQVMAWCRQATSHYLSQCWLASLSHNELMMISNFVIDPVAYNEMAMRSNAAILDYCRTSMSALSGGTAGIIGLTSLYGFAFYFVTACMLSVSTVGNFRGHVYGLQWNFAHVTTAKLLWVTYVKSHLKHPFIALTLWSLLFLSQPNSFAY